VRWVPLQEEAQYRGLSTAQRTVKLSAASVEMTFVWWGEVVVERLFRMWLG
jgi:hypothetical protein